MNVKEIVREWLETHEGYDGLCNEMYECGCGLDNLMPCCDSVMDCEVAYEVKQESGEFDIIYVPGKRPKGQAKTNP